MPKDLYIIKNIDKREFKKFVVSKSGWNWKPGYTDLDVDRAYLDAIKNIGEIVEVEEGPDWHSYSYIYLTHLARTPSGIATWIGTVCIELEPIFTI